ncbi:MAG: hypothetical protein ACKOCW_01545 [Planctomycetaceae bacterium]
MDDTAPRRRPIQELLPAWFTDRIAAAPCRMALLLATSQVLVVDRIRAVREAPGGAVWIDVELMIPHRKDGFPWGHFPVIKSSSPDRALCSINAAHVVAVVEVDTWELPPLEPQPE